MWYKSDVLWWCIQPWTPPADAETLLAQAVDSFSTSEAPDPHAVSALCTHMTSPLIPPRCAGECCCRAGRDLVCLPLLADPGQAPGGCRRSSLWVSLRWGRLDSSGRLWSCRSSPAPGHPWFRSISFPKVPGHLRETDPFLKGGQNARPLGDADTSLRTQNLHGIRHGDSCQRKEFCGFQLLHMEADDNFTTQAFSSR